MLIIIITNKQNNNKKHKEQMRIYEKNTKMVQLLFHSIYTLSWVQIYMNYYSKQFLTSTVSLYCLLTGIY